MEVVWKSGESALEIEMKEHLGNYVIRLYHDVPTGIYAVLLSFFCIGTIGLIIYFGWKQGWRKVLGLLMVEYVFLIYCTTVFCRDVTEGVVGSNFSPLWSYAAIKNGKEDLIVENIMNVVVFVPVGMMLGSLLRVKGLWLIVLATGLCISCSIEALQYFLKRGFSEVDDVFHNTLGCLIGFMIVAILRGIWQFCSYLFLPQWGRTRSEYESN